MHSRELPILTRLEKLDEAVTDINKHNRSLCCGYVIEDMNAELLTAFFEGDLEKTKELSSSQKSAPSNAREIFYNHGSHVRQAGFDLVIKDNTQIGIVLADVDKATNFIFKIPNGWSNSKVILEFAKTVEPFIESFELIVEQERFDTLTKDTRYLVDLMSRRGMAAHLEGAYILLNAAEDGYLKEQILANRSQLLNDKLVGPKGWHHKMMPANLYDQWHKALDTLREIKKNPNARDLTVELERVLRFGLETFDGTLDIWADANNPYRDDRHKEFRGVAKLIRGEFEDVVGS